MRRWKGRTYRYLDCEPLYPFGYGLTYGDVQVESAVVARVPGSAFLVVNEEGVFVKGSGHNCLYMGVGQPDARTAALTGKKSMEVSV